MSPPRRLSMSYMMVPHLAGWWASVVELGGHGDVLSGRADTTKDC